MKYIIVGIDQWKAEAFNTNIEKGDYVNVCRCGECEQVYDSYDPCMVKKIIHMTKIAKDDTTN